MRARNALLAATVAIAGCGRLDFAERGAGDAGAGDPHLIASYPLDDIAVGVTPDVTGHGFDATCTACPLFEPSPHGRAAHFDGSSHRLDVAGSARLDTPSGFTVTAWFRADTTNPDYGCFVNKGYGATTVNSWQVCLTSARTLFFGTSETGNLFTTQTIPLGEWHHVAIRWDGVIKTLSIDGVDNISGGATTSFDGSDLHLGADLDSGSQFAGFPGSIDEVRLYDRALDESEIAALAGS